ncbi:RNA polymerase sigma factor [Pleomorphomonas oryzae]|uniref:RNA polymerase sigma factor n=1 Tax=Pleomorphomonas oryzae TaxID=261934 RepID=UPI0003F67B08|nr:sigma-70 family RNA polymerase sigma factor [Pleomorphomonas oryzae]
MEQSDDALIRAVAAGDERAFRRLVDRHGPKLRAIAGQFLGAGDADDAVQDALIRLWRHADRFDPDKAALSTWLYRVVVNRCIDIRRQRFRWPWRPIDEAEDLPSTEIGADRMLVGAETLRDVAAIIASLPPRQRMALMLATVGDHTAEDIAAILGVSRAAAEQLIARARRNVRDAMRKANHGSD